jgi:hypothetical protein
MLAEIQRELWRPSRLCPSATAVQSGLNKNRARWGGCSISAGLRSELTPGHNRGAHKPLGQHKGSYKPLDHHRVE